MRNNQRGGARVNAGRPSRFNEPVVRLRFSVPASKEAIIKKKIEKIISAYAPKPRKK